MVRAVLVISAAVIVWVDGPGLLAAWNLLPVAVVGALARGLHADAGHRWGRVDFPAFGAFAGFAIGSLSVTLYVHLGWALEMGGWHAGPGTTGPVLVLLPLLATAIGLLVYPAGWLAARLLGGRLCA